MSAPANSIQKPDIVVAGGGSVGLTFATAVARALGGDFSVVVCDPGLVDGSPRKDMRASAVGAAARRVLSAVGAWDALAGSACPIHEMRLSDSAVAEPVRSTRLSFAGAVAAGEPFAHMVENAALGAALLETARRAGVVIAAERVARVTARSDGAVIATGGPELRASLVVAADGARSRLREAAGIAFFGWPYRQHALSVTIAHERDHGGCAVQHFFGGGPLAVLPLLAPDGSRTRASIVWTDAPDQIARLARLAAPAFEEALTSRVGRRLGRLTRLGAVETYPLALGVARRFHGERLALVGDAAHAIHPIAGQGLNLGIADAAALAECVVDAVRLGEDPGAAAVLARYEQARRYDVSAMAATTDLVNRLFSNDRPGLRMLRGAGLGLLDRSALAKRFLIDEAAGLRGTRARLVRAGAL